MRTRKEEGHSAGSGREPAGVRDWLGRIGMVLLGTALTGYGNAMTFASTIGVIPMSMFEEGFSYTCGLSLGNGALIVCVGVLLLGVLLDRKSVGVGSVLTSLTYGIFLDAAAPLIPTVPQVFFLKVGYHFIGLVIISLGIAIYLLPELGVGAGDILMELLRRKSGKRYAFARVATDLGWFVLGLLLGGTAGVGTVLSLLLTGPLLELFMKLLRPLFVHSRGGGAYTGL